MHELSQWQQVVEQTYPFFKKIKRYFVREASYLKREQWTLNDLLDYTQLRHEFSDYLWLDPDELDALTLQVMDARHPEQAPLFEQFRHQALAVHQDVYAPRPLYWGESWPVATPSVPQISERGLSYRCNVALVAYHSSQPQIVGNWVLDFAGDIPVTRPAPALEMTLNSLYLLPEWRGYGIGSVVNRVLSELLCKILAPPLARALPQELSAPPAIQFDADYTSRNGKRLGKQISRRLAPLARKYGLLYYDSSDFSQQGSARGMV